MNAKAQKVETPLPPAPALPWGSDPEAAIRWAYEGLTVSAVPSSSIANLTRPKRGGPPTEWASLDRIDQASTIRFLADRIESAELRAYITAAYLPTPVRESVPGGGGAVFDRFGTTRGAAIRALAYYMREGHPKVSQTGAEEVIAQYITGVQNNDAMCRAMRLRRERAGETRKDWYARLDDIHARAMQAVGARLRKVGLL